jgi:hypothetical protein
MKIVVRLAVLSIVFLAACSSTQPYSASVPASTDLAATCSCAMTALHKYGYTIVDVDSTRGFLTAVRKRNQSSITGYIPFENELQPQYIDETMFDRLTLAIVEDSSRQLTVTATGVTTSGKNPGPSYAVKWDIRKLFNTCGEQPPMGHPSSRLM